jgi:UrcA family protein
MGQREQPSLLARVACHCDRSPGLRDRSPQTSGQTFRVLAGSPGLARTSPQSGNEETIVNPSTPSTRLRGLVATALFSVLVTSVSIVSAADPNSATRTVKFADLNISNPSGAHALYMRILAAAQVVCSHYSFATDADTARCVRDAIADAVTKVNEPALSAVYSAKHKAPAPGRLVSQRR